jgi:hypothetical protein
MKISPLNAYKVNLLRPHHPLNRTPYRRLISQAAAKISRGAINPHRAPKLWTLWKKQNYVKGF